MTARLMDVPASAIRLTPANPRTDGETDLDGLAASLVHGLAQRPTLIEIEPGVFEVLIGERRVRAGLASGWEQIPAVVEAPLDPIVALSRRIVENLHRKDLNPLDEARALKLGWLCANAAQISLSDQTNAALVAGDIRAGLESVRTLLAEAGWAQSRPPVTQEAFLEGLGLGISKASLRKKLQVLNLSDAAQDKLDTLGLTAAGIRAFMRLDSGQQDALLKAIDADPALARKVKTIIQDVTKRGYPMPHALALARGEVWTGLEDDAIGGVREDAELVDDAEEGDPFQPPARSTSADRPAPAEPQLSAGDAAQAAALSKAALELLTRAEEVQSCAAQLVMLLGGGSPTDLPEPNGEMIQIACDLIRESIDPLMR
jgi:ParB-like nuclease domain